MKKPNDIEELFQEAFQNFEADPGGNAWANIQTGMEGGAVKAAVASKGALSVLTKTIIGAAVVTATVGTIYLISSDEDAVDVETLIAAEEITAPEIVESPQDPQIDAEVGLSSEVEVESASTSDKTVSERKSIPVDKSKESSERSAVVEFVDTISTAIQDFVFSDPLENAPEEVEVTEKINEESFANQEQAEAAAENISSEPSSKPSAQEETVSAMEDENRQEQGAEETVTFPRVPNAFSPNLDGINDEFKIDATDDGDLMEIQIISPSLGKMVFQTKGKSVVWNGTLPNGDVAPVGSYLYTLILHKDGEKHLKQGTISLLLK